MLEALSVWLQKIILLVLLATFLDMLLPTSAMQRYVKFVMGLLILLSIISPIIQLFEQNLSPDRLAMRIMNVQHSSSDGWKDLEQVSKRLVQQNDEQAQQFVKNQMETLIGAKIEEQYGVRVESVNVSLIKEMDKEQAYPVISSVQLILDKDIEGVKNGGQEGNFKIQPVEPVTIDVTGDSTGRSPAISTSPELTATERKLLNEIANDIAQTWSIDRTQVVAIMEGKREEG